MNILIIPGWLMNERSFNGLSEELIKRGHTVSVFRCPGIATAEKNVNVETVIRLLFDKIATNKFDVIIAHSFAVNWLLQMKSMIKNKKILLLSPCHKNLNLKFRILKYVSIFLTIAKHLPLPYGLLRVLYDFVHASGERTCTDMINGYFTCDGYSAYKLLIQTLKLECKSKRTIKGPTLVVHGNNDPLLKCEYIPLIMHFDNTEVKTVDCGHDTFNYISDDIIEFIEK